MAISAVPAAGWKFDHWNGPVTDGTTTNANHVLMDTDKTITAVFTQLPIYVTAPNGGEKWRVGSAREIKWTHAPDTGSSVKIELLKKGKVKLTIATSTSNDGSHMRQVCWRDARSRI